MVLYTNFLRSVVVLSILLSFENDSLAQSLGQMEKQMEALHSHNQDSEALVIAIRVQEKTEKRFGSNSKKNLIALTNLALLHDELDQYTKAKECIQKVISIDSTMTFKPFGQMPRLYNDIAVYFANVSDYPKAIKYGLRALSYDTILGLERTPSHSKHLGDCGDIYKSLGQIENAIEFLNNAIEIDSIYIPSTNANLAGLLGNLGGIYSDLGEAQKGEFLLIRALKLDSAASGATSTRFAARKNNLALHYLDFGEYEKAFPLLLQVLYLDTVGNRLLMGSHASHLNTVGLYYKMTGQFERSLWYYQEAIKIDSVIGIANNPGYARYLNNLALAYQNLGNIEMAESLMRKILAIDTAYGRISHPSHARHLNCLADLYVKRAQHSEAILIYQRALSIMSESVGCESREYAIISINLAQLFQHLGCHQEAEPLYQNARSIIENVYGTNSEMHRTALRLLTKFYFCDGQWTHLEESLGALFHLENQLAMHTLIGFDTKTRCGMWGSHEKSYGLIHSCLFNHQISDSILAGRIGYSSILFEKGVLMQSDIAFRHAINGCEGGLLQQNATQLTLLWQNLSAIQRSRFLRPQDVERINAEIEKYEMSLRVALPEYAKSVQGRRVVFEDLTKVLSLGQAAIEFVKFRSICEKSTNDSIFYGAYVLVPPNPAPSLVKLCSESQIMEYIAKHSPQPATDSEELNLAIENRGVSVLYRSKMIDELENESPLWSPIAPLLRNVTEIFYSPDGLIHNISLHTLPLGLNETISDRYRLHTMSSTSKLCVSNRKLFSSDLVSVAAFGGMNYDLKALHRISDEPIEDAFLIKKTNEQDRLNAKGCDQIAWGKLESTGHEVNMIDRLLEECQIVSLSLLENDATEESFKSLQHTCSKFSPTIIHVATHGFSYLEAKASPPSVYPITMRDRLRWSNDPLLRSGLIFSGANRVWMGGEPIEGEEDGILTAAEIANMDLSDTKLVVLSACQSGLGEIQGTEGVFGLQRAFKLAGVELILATLWQVPDAETAEFMELFYTAFLKDGLEVRDAFFKAQGEMRERYRDEPYLWGAFVLLE